jgi:hypothetical protein
MPSTSTDCGMPADEGRGRGLSTEPRAAASQSTSRLEMPRKTEATRLTAALVDQAGATIRPRKQEILDIDDTPGGDPSIVPK